MPVQSTLPDVYATSSHDIMFPNINAATGPKEASSRQIADGIIELEAKGNTNTTGTLRFQCSTFDRTTTRQQSVGNEIVASTSSYDPTPTSPSTSVLLMCAEVEVFNPNTPEQVVKTTAFLDSGSSRSYITTDLANRLALPTEETEEISMFTFGTEKPVPLSATHHAIGLQTHKGPEILYVKAIQHLTNDLKMVTLREDIGTVTTFTTESRKPSILIGADYFWNIILSDDFYVKTLPSGYQIVHSSIGDIVTGKPLRTEEAANYCYNSTTDELEKLDKLLQRFFDLESQGIVDTDMTADDEMCMRKFNETISYDIDENSKILGISWNVRSDQFTIKLPTLPDPDITWTKRQVLKIVAKTYDPLVSVEGEARMGRSSTTTSSEIWKDITSSWTATNIKIERKLLK
ncbi:unnamed protein product, partial [Haemonchus placei]|uniref:DUF1758 domain-containing protein n=1 Tax=Haemonchus placei TaxID=6290 RepID=A0A0N4VVX3_HAEPC